MKGRLLLMLLLFGICPLATSQVPHGVIAVDLTNFKGDIELVSKDDSNLFWTKQQIKWKTKGFEIFPSFGKISLGNDRTIYFDYTTENAENSLDTLLFNNAGNTNTSAENDKQMIPVLADGWVNFSFHRQTYYVTHLKTANANQYIYIFTGGNEPQFEKIDDTTLKKISLTENILYKNLTFKPGTYLINLYDLQSRLHKKIQRGKDISAYVTVASENSLVIDNKGVKIHKISSTPVSPADIVKYYQNKDLKRPQVVKKLLAVFEEK